MIGPQINALAPVRVNLHAPAAEKAEADKADAEENDGARFRNGFRCYGEINAVVIDIFDRVCKFYQQSLFMLGLTKKGACLNK